MTVTRATVHSDFEEVAARFEAEADGDAGAQLVVRVDGEVVLDLASVIAPDAIMTVYSCSKGAAAVALAVLVDRGELDLDERVATYWPEFAAAEKGAVTVRQLLSHQAGLPEVDGRIPVEAWRKPGASAALLAAQRPLWRPGAAFGYHALTIGELMRELCLRITGRSVQQFWEEEVRAPRGIDFYLGLPESEEPRVAELQTMAPPTDEQLAWLATKTGDGPGAYGAVVFGSVTDGTPITTAEGRRLGLPGAGGVGSARGLAGIYAATLGPDALVSADTVDRFAQPQVVGYDVVLDQHRSHGIVFQKPTPRLAFGSYRSFGHDGAGGALAYADPIGGIAFGYTVQRMPFPGGADARAIGYGAMARQVVLAS